MQPVTIQAAPRPFLALTAGDLMSAPVLSIPQHTSLREAARLLARSDISGAPVVDGEGRCLGVLSSHDFVVWAGKDGEARQEGEAIRFVAPWGEMIDIAEAPENEIRQYMTKQPVTVAPTAPVGELAQMMIDAHIHRILVVGEDNRPCGIVTSTDILAAVARAAAAAPPKAAGKKTKSRAGR
jgi:CBS domain-containing protein